MKRLTGASSLMVMGVVLLAACSGEGGGDATSEDAGIVNVYSHRHYDTDQELFRRFTESTGIRVNVQTASADELITRLETEGPDTQADILVTVDAGRLERAKVRGLLRAVSSETLHSNVPDHLRDPDGHWYGLTQRGRVIVYAKDRVSPEDLSSYEDLADPKWRGEILVRSSENIYNQSLLASMIAVHGDDEGRTLGGGRCREHGPRTPGRGSGPSPGRRGRRRRPRDREHVLSRTPVQR